MGVAWEISIPVGQENTILGNGYSTETLHCANHLQTERELCLRHLFLHTVFTRLPKFIRQAGDLASAAVFRQPYVHQRKR